MVDCLMLKIANAKNIVISEPNSIQEQARAGMD
jgi:hypothetical protein